MSIMKNKCYECRNYLGCGYDAETQACKNFMPKGKTTVFDRLISSPEGLAEKLVYDWGHLCHNGDVKIYWKSTILPDTVFGSKYEAIAATVAKLKEVCDG